MKMKKLFKLVLSILFVFILSACNSTISTNEEATNTQSIETMELNQNYTLDIGESIHKITSDANIEISYHSEGEDLTYMLVNGEAEILRH